MSLLVVCLGENTGEWLSVFRLASMPEWEKVFLVGSKAAGEHLDLKSSMSFVSLDFAEPLNVQIKKVRDAVGDVAFGEVGVSLFSGDGLLHMVVLSALLGCGCGIKLVHYSDSFVEL